jgi:hypothetical protein
MTTPSTSRRWSDDEIQPSDINYNTKVEIQTPEQRPSSTFTMTRQDAEDAAQVFLKSYDSQFDEHALEAADAFYNSFKSACHGISRRDELDRLYNATYPSFGADVVERPPFNKVLFAMARSMRVVKVIRGGTLEWTVFDRRPRFDDRRDDHRPRFDDRRDDRRPQFDDRQDNYRPRFDDRREDRRPRYDDHRHDRSPHYNDRNPRFERF